jgi:hypothetical protein
MCRGGRVADSPRVASQILGGPSSQHPFSLEHTLRFFLIAAIVHCHIERFPLSDWPLPYLPVLSVCL